jgi:adenylosuccinate lyase
VSLSFQPLSPLDGRYASQVQELSLYLSEAALNRARIKVEIEWLILLANKNIFGDDCYITEEQARRLRTAVDYFSDADVAKLAETEARTRHDVKAVEYFVRDKLTEIDREDLHELAHFAATSEDINNLSYALIIKDAVNKVWLPKAKQIVETLSELARSSAHVVAVPTANWPELAQELVESLGLKFNPLTTQIESHDWQAELYTAVAHFNRVLHNLATDIWSYISIGYFKQIPVKGATGSSTMPHKINPIRFENAEANLEISNALFDILAATLVTSRLQRDLTDSSSQRNIGVAFGHSLLALDNIAKGLTEIEVAESVMAADLAENWEVLTEAIQTVIRAEVVSGRSKISNPYDLLKDLSRGKRLTREDLANFILKLDIEQAAKDRLLVLSPKDYIGLAAKLAQF